MIRTSIFRGLAATALFAALAGAQTTSSVVGGRLTLNTPSTDQNVKVEVEGVTTRVFGFPGIADGAAYSGLTGVSVNTGAGNDQVAIVVKSTQSFDVRVNTAGGPSTTQVEWDILQGAQNVSANIVLAGAAANRNVLIDIESEARNASLNINAGTATELNAKVVSPNTSDALRVTFDGNAPKTIFEAASNASAVELDLCGGGTAAADELVYKLSQSRPAAVLVNWGVVAGGGDDKLEAALSAGGGNMTLTGRVALGAGNDFLKLEAEAAGTTTGLLLDGGAGNDEISQLIKGRFQMSQTLGTTMLGGDGEDTLVLTTDIGIFGTGLPNDVNPIINCGPGNDRFWAFGQIIACEARL
jgi:hypothetical protein